MHDKMLGHVHGDARGLRPKFAEGSKCEALAHEAEIDRTYVSALERSEYSAPISLRNWRTPWALTRARCYNDRPSRGNRA
jgi:hypothetical protein